MGILSKIFGVDPEFMTGRGTDAEANDVGEIPKGADFRTKVEAVLDQVRPGLRADGGDVHLVDVIGHSVRVRLVGACDGCSSSTHTLRYGIENRLRDSIPEFEDLIPF